jgi:hypothetical protein
MNVLYEWQGWGRRRSVRISLGVVAANARGRAFGFVAVDDRPAVEGELSRHSWWRLRRRPVELSREDLERPERGEPRELEAAPHNIRQLQAEAARLAE